MRKRRSQLLEADQQGVGKLIQDFSILEREWKSFNSSKPRPLRRMSSADSSNATLKTFHQLLSNSPRSLMSSLQIRGRSSNDAAREEIIRDRKAALESGKLKGRRLFEVEERETEVGFAEREEICSVSSYGNEGKGSCGRSKQDQVVSGYHVRCCSGLGSSLSDEKAERREVAVVGGGGGEKVVGLNVEEVKRCEVGVKGKGGEMWMILGGWFSIVLMIFALGIIYMSCIIGGYGDKDEVMLVPT